MFEISSSPVTRGDRDARADVGAGVRDEDLRAVDRPTRRRAARPSCASRPRRSPRPARSARTRRGPGPTRAAAATPASAPRCRRGRIGIVPSDVCAATVIATDESMRVSSSIAIAYETVSPPAPPYSSGIGSPISPSSASSATSSYGKRSSRSSSSATGATLRLRELADGAADQLLLVSRARSSRDEPAELGDEPDAVAGSAWHAEVVAAAALEERRARPCRRAPTGRRRRTRAGTRRRARASPGAGSSRSSCPRTPSRCSGGSGDGAGTARRGRRCARPASRIRSRHASSFAKTPA